jgi:hypothetical protein
MANLRVNKITSTETFEKTGSVQFDGSGDYLSHAVSSDFQFGSGDFTIECWIYKEATQNDDILGVYNTSSNRRSFLLHTPSEGTIVFILSPTGSGGTSFTTDENIIEPSTWYHIAVVRNGNDVKIFKDGSLVKSGSYTGSVYENNDDEFRIGSTHYSAANSREFDGNISNVRIIKGKALYTANFKPPMRELEVTPETVLLACQSKTDASLEKTGKTITVNGNAVASELTPGILTPVPKAGGGSAITGSVEFDGTGDYLSSSTIISGTGFGTNDFSIDFWINPGQNSGNYTGILNLKASTAADRFQVAYHSSNIQVYTDTGSWRDTGFAPDIHSWTHISFVRNYSGNTLKMYANGVEEWSVSNNHDYNEEFDEVWVGRHSSQSTYLQAFISNLRIVNGTALYTNDFIPPTRELKKVPGTVLLCCQDKNSVTTEATGKTITSNGDPAASNFTPQVGDDRSVIFDGVTNMNTENYFYLPTGDTASRETTGTYNAGTRGIFGGGFSTPSTHHDTIQYINIATTGNAIDAGDLTQSRYANAALASDIRAVWGGGTNPSPATYNIMDAVEIMSTGNAFDFGDLYDTVYYPAGVSNRTRGIYAGGYNPADAPSGMKNNIGYITISSKGNTTDFGDLIVARTALSSFNSPTRGVFAAGSNPTNQNLIEYVTIATTGNASDFGDLTVTRRYAGGLSSAIRGLVGGGADPSANNTIDYVTISAMGNAQDFGDLTSARQEIGACSSATRGIFAGAWAPSKVNTMDYVTIQTTANAKDFGDLVNIGVMQECGTSNGHGGLG